MTSLCAPTDLSNEEEIKCKRDTWEGPIAPEGKTIAIIVAKPSGRKNDRWILTKNEELAAQLFNLVSFQHSEMRWRNENPRSPTRDQKPHPPFEHLRTKGDKDGGEGHAEPKEQPDTRTTRQKKIKNERG